MSDPAEEMALKYLRLDRQLKEAQAEGTPAHQLAMPSHPASGLTPTAPPVGDGAGELAAAHHLAWVEFAASVGPEAAEGYLSEHGARLNAVLDAER